MNRVIKFKIILECINNWSTYSVGDKLILFNDIFDEKTGVSFWQIDRDKWKIVEKYQYTGHNDKSGKPIYEGDIVKRIKRIYAYSLDESLLELAVTEEDFEKAHAIIEQEEISSIEYRDNGFWVKDEDFGYEGEDLWDWDHIEVIGNIYETPELLNK